MLIIPFVIQSLVIFIDEFYFHLKRGLPLWERRGHPLDTLTVCLCLAFVLLFPYDRVHLLIYIALSAFSCLFVTKDEFVHKEHAPASEQWLHALLFLNHPLVLIATAFLWKQRATLFLGVQCLLGVLFGLYQLIYWNFVWQERR